MVLGRVKCSAPEVQNLRLSRRKPPEGGCASEDRGVLRGQNWSRRCGLALVTSLQSYPNLSVLFRSLAPFTGLSFDEPEALSLWLDG